MTDRKVAHVVVSYLDDKGLWQLATRGQTVKVHPEDLARLESTGALEADDKKTASK